MISDSYVTSIRAALVPKQSSSSVPTPLNGPPGVIESTGILVAPHGVTVLVFTMAHGAPHRQPLIETLVPKHLEVIIQQILLLMVLVLRTLCASFPETATIISLHGRSESRDSLPHIVPPAPWLTCIAVAVEQYLFSSAPNVPTR